MADFYKSAGEASREVRSSGQTGIAPNDEQGQRRSALKSAAAEMPSAAQIDSFLNNFSGVAERPPEQGAETSLGAQVDAYLDSYLGQFRAQQIEDPVAEPVKTNNAGLGTDIVTSIGSGAVGLGQGIYELGNLATGGYLDRGVEAVTGRSGSSALKGAQDYLQSKQSPELQAQRKELQETEGFWNNFTQVLTSPRLLGSMVLEQTPQLLTIAGATRAVVSRTLTTAASRGMAPEAAQALAQTNATRTVLGLNALTEAGSAGADARNDVMTMAEAELSQSPQYQKLVQQYGDTEQGRMQARMRLANDASALAATIAAPISLAASKLSGAAELEAKVFTKGMVGESGKRTALGVAKDIGVGGLKETGEESLQEGGNKFAQNVGLKFSGADPDQAYFEGVPEAAGVGGALGFAAGAGFGAAGTNAPSRSAPRKDATPTTTDPEIKPGAPSSQFAPMMSDDELNQIVNSENGARALAGLYAVSDDATKERLGQFGERLGVDLYTLSQDREVAKYGRSLVGGNTAFVNQLVAKIDSVLGTDTEFGLTPEARRRFEQERDMPEDQNAMAANDFAATNREDAKLEFAIAGLPANEQEQIRQKYANAKSADQGELVPGPTLTQNLNRPGQDVLIRGYERAAANLEGVPAAAQRVRAVSSAEDMRRDGFSEEQVNQVFGRFLNPQQSVPDMGTTVPDTGMEVTEATPEDFQLAAGISQPDAVQTIAPAAETTAPDSGFEGISYMMRRRDQERGEPVEETDYEVADVDPDVKALADALGVQVFGYNYKGKSERAQSVKGTRTPLGIALNMNAKDAHLEVLGHEVYHELANRNPAAARELNREIQTYMFEGELTAKKEALRKRYPEGKVDEEIAADVLGMLFKDRDFWKELGRRKPSLLEQIYRVVADMLRRFTGSTSRGAKTAQMIADLDAVRKMLADFVADSTTEQTTEDDIFVEEPVQEMAEVAPEPAREPGNVKQVAPNTFQGTLAPAPFVEPTDVSTADTTKRGQQALERQRKRDRATQPYSEGLARAIIKDDMERDVKVEKVAQLERDGEVVGEIYRAGNQYHRFNISKNGGYSKGVGPSLQSVTSKLPAGTTAKQLGDPAQAQMDLSYDNRAANRYKAQVQRIMTQMFTPSTVQDTLKELRGKLRSISENNRKFFKFRKGAQSDVEYIFDAFGLETSNKSNAVAAISKAIESAQRQDVKARAGLLKVHAAQISDALLQVRMEMAIDGFSDSEIDSIVKPAQDSLKTLEDSDTTIQRDEEGYSTEGREAEPSLGLPGFQFSEGVQAASAVIEEIEQNKISPIAAVNREMRKPDRQFGFADLRTAMALRGMDVSQLDHEVMQWPAAKFSLGAWVRIHGKHNNNYAARDQWYRSFETIRDIYRNDPEKLAQFEAEISEDEKRVIDYMRAQKKAVKNRRTEELKKVVDNIQDKKVTYARVPYDDVELAFPHALFNNYRLADLRVENSDELTEKVGANNVLPLQALVQGDVKLLSRMWLDDVSFALDARPDLATQIYSGMTAQERGAVRMYREKTRAVIARNLNISERETYQEMLAGIGGLDRTAFQAFSRQIANADVRALPSIMHEAELVASKTEGIKDKKQLGDVLNAYLNQIYHTDEMQSVNLDETTDPDPDVNLPAISDEEVMREMEKMGRQGEPIDYDTARIRLLQEKIAEEAASFEVNDENEIVDQADQEQAADVDTQPENQVGMTQDLWRYKRGRFSDGPARATVEAHIAEITANWPTKPNVSVFYNIDQIQDPELKERLLARAPNGDFKGAIDTETGAVYLFSQKLEGLADAEFVLLHELYGHRGLRAFLGNKLDAFLNNQYRLNKQVRDMADAQRDQSILDGMPMSQLESVEEAISDMAVNGESGLFRQLVGQLVAWLRKHNMNTVADWMDSRGSAELAYVLKQARRAVRTGDGISPLNGAPVRYSRNGLDAVEISAVRDGKMTGYARYNPITNSWAVFVIHDLQQGAYDAYTVDNYQNAYEILKKRGKPQLSRDRSTRNVDADPGSFKQVPNFEDVSGWQKQARDFQIKVQNSYLPLMELARWAKSQGVENSLEEDLKLVDGKIGDVIKRHFEVKYQRPMMRLLKEIGQMGGTVEDVDLFLMARHAEERNGVIKNIDPKNTRGSGLDTKEANELLDTMNNGAWTAYASQLDALGQLIDSMSTDKINYMEQTELISDKAAAALRTQYQHYVNLSGNDESQDQYDKAVLGAKNFSLKKSQLIRATGRGTKAVDVLENTVNSYLSALINGQRSVPARSLLKLAEQLNDPTYAVVEPIKQKKQIDVERMRFDNKILKSIGDAPNPASGREVLRGLVNRINNDEMTVEEAIDELTDKVMQAEKRQDINPQEAQRIIKRINDDMIMAGRLSPDGYISMVEDQSLMLDPSVVVARFNGKPIMMRFDKRANELVEAITGRNMTQSGKVLEAFGAWNRLFSQMVTTWNPIWAAVNGIRDIQTMFANVSADPNVGAAVAAQAMKYWGSSFKHSFRELVADQADAKDSWWGGKLKSLSKNQQRDPLMQKYYTEFMEDGAATFFLDREGVEVKVEKLNRTMNPKSMRDLLDMSKADAAKELAGKAQDKLQGIGDAMELLTMPMELAPRLAVYRTLRENGWSRQDAAVYAKEVTVNFNAKGTASSLRNLFVFFNPAVQGTHRMFKDYSSGTGAKALIPTWRFAAVAGAYMMLGMISNMVANAVGGEDEERGLNKLSMISDYKRATMLIWAPDEYMGATPLAYGWNVFAVAGTYLMDVWNGRISPEVAAQKVASAAVDAFSPIGSGTNSESFAGAVIKTITPSPLVPAVEMAMNESRFGGPIYKTQTPFSDVKETDAFMHFDNVNPISKMIMQGLASATARGNPRYNAGLIDVNPASMDHLISSYLPGLFNSTYQLAGYVINKMDGKDVKDPKIPLVDRLSARIPEEYDKGAVRRVSGVVETLTKEYKAIDTSPQRRQEILREHPGLFTAETMIKGADTHIKNLSRRLENIERRPDVADEVKVKLRNQAKEEERQVLRRVVQVANRAGFDRELLFGKQNGSLGDAWKLITPDDD